ncbi:hypothetical protein Tco_1158304 [Tanacetum coccineum]
MCDNDDQADQNAKEYKDKRVVLANLIVNLKLDHDENKKTLKHLKKANASLIHELNECKYALKESNDIQDRCRSALHDHEIELEKYKKYKNCQLEKEEVERKLKETLGLLTQQKFHSDEALKMQAYETFQFKEKNAELVHRSSLEHTRYDLLRKENKQLKKDFKIRQEKDIEKQIALEHQVNFLNNVIYKRNQSIQTLHMLAPNPSLSYNGRPSFVNPKYLKKAQSEKPCLYKVPYDKDDTGNSLDVVAGLDGTECGYLGLKSVDTKFDKPSVVRQPNALRIPKPSVLGKPTPFSDSLERKTFSKTKPVTKTNVLESLSKPVTTRILPQNRNQAVKNKNVIKPRMYQIDTRTTQTRAPQLPQTSRNTNPRVSTSIGVIHNTSVSRPQLKSTQMKDKVMQTNSQVKFKKTK